jgi:RHS repeat-associated core domain protein
MWVMIWWLSTPPRGTLALLWVQDPGTGELVAQVNLTTTNNNDTIDGPGLAGWSQAQVDAVFYALVADLAGAPQELIDTEQSSVVGHVTQSLFGRRSWSGVESPVLFAGQYEDAESGWVYNRFRFYDPAGGVYGS